MRQTDTLCFFVTISSQIPFCRHDKFEIVQTLKLHVRQLCIDGFVHKCSSIASRDFSLQSLLYERPDLLLSDTVEIDLRENLANRTNDRFI